MREQRRGSRWTGIRSRGVVGDREKIVAAPYPKLEVKLELVSAEEAHCPKALMYEQKASRALDGATGSGCATTSTVANDD